MTGLFSEEADTFKPTAPVMVLVGRWLGAYAFCQQSDSYHMRKLARRVMESLYKEVAAPEGMFDQIEARRRAERRWNPNIL